MIDCQIDLDVKDNEDDYVPRPDEINDEMVNWNLFLSSK